MLNDGFDHDTVLGIYGLAPADLASEVINLAEWPVPGNAQFTAMILTSSAPDNAAGVRINGAWAAFAIICDVLCGRNVSSKGTILRGTRPSDNHTANARACSHFSASRRSTVLRFPVRH